MKAFVVVSVFKKKRQLKPFMIKTSLFVLFLGAVWVDLCVVQGAASKLAENVGGERHEVCGRLADELLEHLDWLLLAEAVPGDDGVHGGAAGRGDSATAARSEGVLQLRKVGGDGGLGHVGRDPGALGSRLVGDRVRVARGVRGGQSGGGLGRGHEPARVQPLHDGLDLLDARGAGGHHVALAGLVPARARQERGQRRGVGRVQRRGVQVRAALRQGSSGCILSAHDAQDSKPRCQGHQE